MICDAGDVVLIPFPFVDMPVAKVRPALIVSARAFNAAEQQSVLPMITTAARSQWTSDTAIQEWATAGLRSIGVIRMKLFTLENRLIQRRIGRLSPVDHTRFGLRLRESLSAFGQAAEA